MTVEELRKACPVVPLSRWHRIRWEIHLTLKALAQGWPGLALFVLMMVVAFMMGDR